VILFLRTLFILVLLSMLAVTSWASLHVSVLKIPREVLHHPWFIATLVDAYWAFITFYVWAAWKECSLAARIRWFVAIIALGNIAMAIYLLRELFRVPADSGVGAVFTQRHPGRVMLPAILAATGIAVYCVA
jgi:hypothetical protein